jgi:hypothetical protein
MSMPLCRQILFVINPTLLWIYFQAYFLAVTGARRVKGE